MKIETFKNFFLSLKHSSIRAKIVFSLAVSTIITMSLTILLSVIVTHILEDSGKSYQSNAELDLYLMQLSETEAAMETYMHYRTFESIDKYYHYEAAAERTISMMNDRPSENEFLQREYKIHNLSLTFLELGNKAIAARRANNSLDTDYYFKKCLDCYNFLRSEIIDLNMLYFTRNATNYNTMKNNTSRFISRAILSILIILVSVSILIYMSIMKITQPLKEISQVALKVADRDFDITLFNSDSRNEIGNICRAFDAMIISIREYIDTIWEKAMKENELREKEIEMRALYTDAHFKALQDQIQPHFLFNTLNTGAQLAMIEGADKTCYFLEQVADFLRYNIQHPGSDATIQEELGMLDNYIYIMKVRFGERYKFIKEIDETAFNVRMPNTILQPLVENCLKHGLKDVSENGKITIRVQKNSSDIQITISDNGKGFDPEKKDRIMSDAERGSNGIELNRHDDVNEEHVSAGLVNVVSRLQLYFHSGNVFDILPNPEGKGTMFVINIPDNTEHNF